MSGTDSTETGAVMTVPMDAGDFCRLHKDWDDRLHVPITKGRFFAGPGREVDGQWEWKRIYWFGDDYAALLLARAFTVSLGFRCEVLQDIDEYRGSGLLRGWCILTDYDETTAL